MSVNPSTQLPADPEHDPRASYAFEPEYVAALTDRLIATSGTGVTAYAPATGQPLAVTLLATSVLPASAADPPTVSASTNRSIYVAGQTGTITVTVWNVGPSAHLKVVARNATGASKVLDDTDVNSEPGTNHATKHYSLFLAYDSKVDVFVAGATEPDKTLSLPVRAAVGSVIAGYYQRSGSYAVFPTSAHPSFRSQALPARQYRCIRHEVWRKYSSTWKVQGLSACKYENSAGVVTWQWLGSHSSGVHYRVRARFLGDSLNHPNNGAFIYFTFK